jgi:hypothetical protein
VAAQRRRHAGELLCGALSGWSDVLCLQASPESSVLMDSHDAAYDLVKEHKDVRSAFKRDGARVSLRPLTQAAD